MVKITKTINVKTTDKDGQQHEYHSLEEVPPEIRAELEKLETQTLKEGLRSSSSDDHSIQIKTQKSFSLFRVKDASGNERVYHSVEELPPEIRAALDQTQNKAKQ